MQSIRILPTIFYIKYTVHSTPLTVQYTYTTQFVHVHVHVHVHVYT